MEQHLEHCLHVIITLIPAGSDPRIVSRWKRSRLLWPLHHLQPLSGGRHFSPRVRSVVHGPDRTFLPTAELPFLPTWCFPGAGALWMCAEEMNEGKLILRKMPLRWCCTGNKNSSSWNSKPWARSVSIHMDKPQKIGLQQKKNSAGEWGLFHDIIYIHF